MEEVWKDVRKYRCKKGKEVGREVMKEGRGREAGHRKGSMEGS